MTFPNPEYNIYDLNSAYPYNLGPNPFDASKEYEGADIVAPFTNNYPEEPKDVWATTFPPMSLHEIMRSWNPLFNHLITMEDALPEELR